MMPRIRPDTAPTGLRTMLTLMALVLAFALAGAGEYFYDDCDEHGAEECSADCGCVHCVSQMSAVQADAGRGDNFGHPRVAQLASLTLPSEETCPGGIDRPPELL